MIWKGLIFLLIGVFINFINDNDNLGVCFGTLLACVGAALITANEYETKPTAMDVYQGKTTLEITYKDGLPIDTIVVFKNKEK